MTKQPRFGRTAMSLRGNKRRARILELAEAQNWRCCYCHIRCSVDKHNQPDCATIEHFIPYSHARKLRLSVSLRNRYKRVHSLTMKDNTIMACHECNRE